MPKSNIVWKKLNEIHRIVTQLIDSFLFSRTPPPGIIYHGNQSSTSSDLSPMSEQKSLPRRGRSRYHQQTSTYTTNTTPRHTRQQPPQSTSNTPTITPTTLLVASPHSSSSNSNKTRMPSQFRPIQHRTMNYPITRQSPSC